MKQNRFIIYAFAVACLLLAGSCKTTRKIAGTGDGTPKAHTEFFSALQESAFKYQTLTAKTNVDLNIPGQNLSSRVDLKMVKDKAFQLSVQPFLGIEIFKIEVSTDSIKVLDRMNKRYVAESFARLKGQMPVDFNFYNLQALFTNQLFLPGEQVVTPKLYKRFSLKQENGNAEIKAKDALDLIYIFSTDKERKLINTSVKDGSEQYAMEWNYTNFRLYGNQPFPSAIEIRVSAKGKEQGGLKLNFSKIDIDKPLSLEFSIPAKYKRITFAEILKSISNSKK